MSRISELRFTTRDGSFWEPRFIDRILSGNCTKCGFCRKVCPARVFEQDGGTGVVIARPGACRGCAVCEMLCKARAIVCKPWSELPPPG